MFVRKRKNAVLDRESTEALILQVIAYDTPNGPENVRKQGVASVSYFVVCHIYKNRYLCKQCRAR